MKKQQKKSQIITMTALAVFGLGMVFSIYGLSTVVTNIDKDIIGRGDEKSPNNIITTNDDMFWQRP